MTPQGFPNGKSGRRYQKSKYTHQKPTSTCQKAHSTNHKPKETYPKPSNPRVRKDDELARFDDLLLGVTLGGGVRARLREVLLDAVNEKVRLCNQLGHITQKLCQRDQQLEDLRDSSETRNQTLCRENAVLQSRMAVMKKGDAYKKPEPVKQNRARRTKVLPDRSADIEALRKRSYEVQEETRKLREEVGFLRGIINDRQDGGLLTLFEGGKKLFDKQGDQVDKLTTNFKARIDKAVHAAEVAKQEKNEVITALEAKLSAKSSEKHEAMGALEEKLNAELQEKDNTIATLKAMSRPPQPYDYPHTMGGAGMDQHIPDIESTLLFIRSLKHDVEARDKTIVNLRAREAKSQAKQAEMVTFGAAGKAAQLKLQGRFEAPKKAHAELKILLTDSQNLIKKLNNEHEKLVRQMGRKL